MYGLYPLYYEQPLYVATWPPLFPYLPPLCPWRTTPLLCLLHTTLLLLSLGAARLTVLSLIPNLNYPFLPKNNLPNNLGEYLNLPCVCLRVAILQHPHSTLQDTQHMLYLLL